MRLLFVLLCLTFIPSLSHAQDVTIIRDWHDMEEGKVYRIPGDASTQMMDLKNRADERDRRQQAANNAHAEKMRSAKQQIQYERAPEVLENTYQDLGVIEELYRVAPDGLFEDEVVEAKAIVKRIEEYYTQNVRSDLDLENIRTNGRKRGVDLAHSVMARSDSLYDRKIKNTVQFKMRGLRNSEHHTKVYVK